MFRRTRPFIGLLAVLALTIAACGPQPTLVPGSGNAPLPAPSATLMPLAHPSLVAASAAQAWLAAQLGVPIAQVVVQDMKQADWPDGCLGLPKPTELCAMHVTPGWSVALSVNDKLYEVRTDQTGAIVRANLTLGKVGGTKWTLVSFGLPGAETLVLAGSNLTLNFDAAGQASGNAGCNMYNGKYSATTDTLAFGALISTKRACVDEGMNQQESRYLAGLQTAGKYTLTGERLTVFTDSGKGALNFVKV